eukprot:Polyplicarium_translucidae@DN3368_c2_g2_i9.p1
MRSFILFCAALWRCQGNMVMVQCWDFDQGAQEAGCGREWTEREAEGHCGEITRPCAVHAWSGLDPANDCGRCITLRERGTPIYGKIIGGVVSDEDTAASYRITSRAFNKMRSGEESENSCHSLLMRNIVEGAVDCHAEAKCRDFIPDEEGSCNCATEDSDFENCGDDASNPCVVAMEDAGPLGVNQCNECYQLQLPGSSLLHVRVVDKFDPPVEDDDEWRMQVPRYVYDRLTGVTPLPDPFANRRRRDETADLNTCVDGAAPVNITYTTTRCYDGPSDLCPQRGVTTTTAEPVATSTTTEEPTSTTEEPPLDPPHPTVDIPTVNVPTVNVPTTVTEGPTTTATEEKAAGNGGMGAAAIAGTAIAGVAAAAGMVGAGIYVMKGRGSAATAGTGAGGGRGANERDLSIVGGPLEPASEREALVDVTATMYA